MSPATFFFECRRDMNSTVGRSAVAAKSGGVASPRHGGGTTGDASLQIQRQPVGVRPLGLGGKVHRIDPSQRGAVEEREVQPLECRPPRKGVAGEDPNRAHHGRRAPAPHDAVSRKLGADEGPR